MGNIFHKPYRADIILSEAITKLQKIDDPKFITSTSITYLQREEIITHFQSFINAHDVIRIVSEIEYFMGVAYLIIYVTEEEFKRWKISFLPCSRCPCIKIYALT